MGTSSREGIAGKGRMDTTGKDRWHNTTSDAFPEYDGAASYLSAEGCCSFSGAESDTTISAGLSISGAVHKRNDSSCSAGSIASRSTETGTSEAWCSVTWTAPAKRDETRTSGTPEDRGASCSPTTAARLCVSTSNTGRTQARAYSASKFQDAAPRPTAFIGLASPFTPAAEAEQWCGCAEVSFRHCLLPLFTSMSEY
jgi:hypothetical protein